MASSFSFPEWCFELDNSHMASEHPWLPGPVMAAFSLFFFRKSTELSDWRYWTETLIQMKSASVLPLTVTLLHPHASDACVTSVTAALHQKYLSHRRFTPAKRWWYCPFPFQSSHITSEGKNEWPFIRPEYHPPHSAALNLSWVIANRFFTGLMILGSSKKL